MKAKHLGKSIDENCSHPIRYRMSLRVSVIKIDDYYGDAESQKVQGEGKEEELGE